MRNADPDVGHNGGVNGTEPVALSVASCEQEYDARNKRGRPMSIKAIHHESGLIALKVQDTGARVMLDVNPPSRPNSQPQKNAPVPPPAPSPVGEKDSGITEIHLGPLPTPPLPLGVVIFTGDVGGLDGSGRRASPLRLDAAFEKGRFSDDVVESIRRSVKGLPEGAQVQVEAYLPPEHSIDVALLSQHVSALGGSVGHPVSMRVGTKIVKD
jgi:hypothetical protein